MSDLKAYLERQYSEYSASALYFGYMDMTYFVFTPSSLKNILNFSVIRIQADTAFQKSSLGWIQLSRHPLWSSLKAALQTIRETYPGDRGYN